VNDYGIAAASAGEGDQVVNPVQGWFPATVIRLKDNSDAHEISYPRLGTLGRHLVDNPKRDHQSPVKDSDSRHGALLSRSRMRSMSR